MGIINPVDTGRLFNKNIPIIDTSNKTIAKMNERATGVQKSPPIKLVIDVDDTEVETYLIHTKEHTHRGIGCA